MAKVECLHDSVLENDLEGVKNLLQKGADPSLTSSNGNSPLHTAVLNNHQEIVEAILKYCNRDTLKKIINAKTADNGSTALHVAASKGFLVIARCLLSHGAIFEVKNMDGKRPIDITSDHEMKKLLVNVELDSKLSARGSYKQLRDRILRHSLADFTASIFARNNEGMTPLQLAVVNNHCNTVNAIVDARLRQIREKSYSLKKGASLDEFLKPGKQFSDHETSLMLHSQDISMMSGETMIDELAMILGAAHEIVRVAERVYKMDSGEPYQQSILLDVIEETLEVLEFKPEHVSYDTADRMVFRGHGARYCKMLCADENSDDFEDERKIVPYMGILQVAIARPVSRFMGDIYTRKMGEATRDNDLAVFEQCMDEQFVDVNVYAVDDDGRSPLHCACEHGNEKMVKALLEKQSQVIFPTYENAETVLHSAAKGGNVEVVRLLLQAVSNMDIMMEWFVDLVTNNEGWTAVHFAAKTGQLDVLKCLLEYRATYDLKDVSGKTAAMLSENKSLTGFLLGIDELFEMARSGDPRLLKKLKALPREELLAVGNARNIKGRTLGKVAEENGHRNVSSQVLKIVERAKPASKKIQDHLDGYTHFREIESYQLMETLAKSST